MDPIERAKSSRFLDTIEIKCEPVWTFCYKRMRFDRSIDPFIMFNCSSNRSTNSLIIAHVKQIFRSFFFNRLLRSYTHIPITKLYRSLLQVPTWCHAKFVRSFRFSRTYTYLPPTVRAHMCACARECARALSRILMRIIIRHMC